MTTSSQVETRKRARDQLDDQTNEVKRNKSLVPLASAPIDRSIKPSVQVSNDTSATRSQSVSFAISQPIPPSSLTSRSFSNNPTILQSINQSVDSSVNQAITPAAQLTQFSFVVAAHQAIIPSVAQSTKEQIDLSNDDDDESSMLCTEELDVDSLLSGQSQSNNQSNDQPSDLSEQSSVSVIEAEVEVEVNQLDEQVPVGVVPTMLLDPIAQQVVAIDRLYNQQLNQTLSESSSQTIKRFEPELHCKMDKHDPKPDCDVLIHMYHMEEKLAINQSISFPFDPSNPRINQASIQSAIDCVISTSMRLVLVEWLFEVACEFHLSRETCHLAINYADRAIEAARLLNNQPTRKPYRRSNPQFDDPFPARAKPVLRLPVSDLPIDSKNYQLLGLACLFLASKIDEIIPPTSDLLLSLTQAPGTQNDGAMYSKDDLLCMEETVCYLTQFRLSPSTTISFAGFMLEKCHERINQFIDPTIESCDNVFLRADLYVRCLDLLDMCMIDQTITSTYYPSSIAAAVICMVYQPNNQPNNQHPIASVTRYTVESLYPIMQSINQLINQSINQSIKQSSVQKYHLCMPQYYHAMNQTIKLAVSKVKNRQDVASFLSGSTFHPLMTEAIREQRQIKGGVRSGNK